MIWYNRTSAFLRQGGGEDIAVLHHIYLNFRWRGDCIVCTSQMAGREVKPTTAEYRAFLS